jgi:hypothetical protein
MWNMECMFILLMIGYTGRVMEGLKNNLENTPAKHK